jgi:hypothetical protein
MFRKTTTALALVTLVMASACNTLVGTDETQSGDPRPQQSDATKFCVDDLRSIAIQTPDESQIVRSGQLVLVTWDTAWLCGSFDVTLYASYDHGATYQPVGQARNAASMNWSVPRLATAPLLKVVAVDRVGEVSDEIGMSSPIVVDPARGGGGRPKDHTPS